MRKNFFGLIIVIVLAMALKYFVGLYFVTDVSMEPTLNKYQPVIVDRKAEPQINDIVLAQTKYGTTIKRLVGKPGDKIRCKNYIISVNGEEIENFAHGDYFSDWEYDLKENEFFIIGDNLDYSYDSRFMGTVNKIIGVIK